jgi:hypothetical protein
MLKALAVVRTLFLVFIAAYALRVVPWGWSRTFDEEFARCTATRAIAIQATWLAVAWILFDTVVSWWLATRKAKGSGLASKVGAEPPPASPPAR